MKTKNFFKSLLKKRQIYCPCCKKTTNKKIKGFNFINLPKYPITEFYRKKNDKLINDALINQQVLFCKVCDHMFLKNILDVNQIYKNYLTSTNSSGGAILCLENFFDFIMKNNKKIKKYNVIDIGGNDSTFLGFFKKHKKKLINIDPNGTSKNSKIICKKVFLENINFSKITNTNEPTIYTSSHTIEHLENPILFLENISKVLTKQDELYLQFPSMEKLIEHKRFDQICHQHINYFSLHSIYKVLKKLKMYINDFEYDTSHFGTLRLKISRNNKIISKLKREKNTFKNAKFAYEAFLNYYTNLEKTLKSNFKEGQGFGAGLMVPILAYYLPLINELKYIIDENQQKINKKFINLKPIIKDYSYIDKNKPILITSVSTKAAGRKIFNKLCNEGIDDICIPSMVI